MKKLHQTFVLAMGSSLLTGLASVANAGEAVDASASVFQMSELSSGYMQLAAEGDSSSAAAKAPEAKCAGAKPITAPKHEEGKCGEGKCGGSMKDAAKPATDSAAKPATDAAAKPATDAKATEGKCGEGKCGGSMKKPADAAAKPAETSPAKK